MNLTLSLTHACNLACSYCYAGPARRSSMSWDVAQRAIELAFAKPPKELVLGFFGGEPLLEWPLLQRATAYAEERAEEHGTKLRPTVTTNGTLLTADRLQWLSEHRFEPAVSLDGDRAMHDAARRFRGGRSSFDACAGGVEAARAVFEDLEVITVVDPANVAHLAAGVRHLAETLGVADISINPNFTATWSPDALATWKAAYREVGSFYLERYRAGGPVGIDFIDSKIVTRLKDGFESADRCGFGERELAVAPSGRIYPCERLIGEDTDEEVCIGDVFDGLYVEKRCSILARRGNVDDPCRECSIRTRCMNWCGCVNYATTGEIDRTHGILCFHERLAVEVADGAAAALFAEGNQSFFERFYYEDDLDL